MSDHDRAPERPAPSGDPRLNPDLARIQRELVALVGRLERGMDDVSSPKAAAALSDAIARRYFLQGAEPLRADGLTLA